MKASNHRTRQNQRDINNNLFLQHFGILKLNFEQLRKISNLRQNISFTLEVQVATFCTFCTRRLPIILAMVKMIRHYILPVLAVVSLILLGVAMMTPWLIRSTYLAEQPTSKFTVTLWSETRRKFKKGKSRTRVSKHTVRCGDEERLDVYDGETCEKLMSSQYLVVFAAVFLCLAIATSFGLTWMSTRKPTIG